MTRILLTALALFLALPALGADSALDHIQKVTDKAPDTPHNLGYLPTALQEAQTAQTHAQFASQKESDLKWMQTHSGHVRHAVTGKGQGPGLGYGLIKACQNVIDEAKAAASTPDSNEAVKTHAHHVETATGNALARAKEMKGLTDEIAQAQSADEVQPMVERLSELAREVVAGKDEDGNGQISWQEGGLSQAKEHMAYMRSSLDH